MSEQEHEQQSEQGSEEQEETIKDLDVPVVRTPQVRRGG